MEEVRRRVVPARRAAGVVVDVLLDDLANGERALLEGAAERDDARDGLLRVVDRHAHALGDDHAAVADLAAGLAVEGRAVEDHPSALPLFHSLDRLAVDNQREDLRLGDLVLSGSCHRLQWPTDSDYRPAVGEKNRVDVDARG